MNGTITFVLPAALMLLPGLASAQSVVSDPQEHAISLQSAAVENQQLAVLNRIQALLQVLVSRPQALAALTYAQQQTEARQAGLNNEK
jgi:hypothetical protein